MKALDYVKEMYSGLKFLNRFDALLKQRITLEEFDNEAGRPRDDTPYPVKRLLLGREFYDLAEKCLVKREISPGEFRKAVKEKIAPDFSYSATCVSEGASDYLRLAEKGLVFNQICYDIERDFPDCTKQDGYLCSYSKTNLAALSFLNGLGLPFSDPDAGGYRKMSHFGGNAVRIAKEMYDPGRIKEILETIDSKNEGRTPLGAEAEFSNLGRKAVEILERDGLPDKFSNFRHAWDFNLCDIYWRLGAYIDNHTQDGIIPNSNGPGFFEIPFNKRYSISRPITNNPWFLSEMVKQATLFFKDIKPHSLHVNIERTQTGNREIGFDDLICLLYMGGDFGLDEEGTFRERRLFNNEVVLIENHGDMYHGYSFPRGIFNMQERKNGYSESGDLKRPVEEYHFIRLRDPTEDNADYEPLIMALKGFQFSHDPKSRHGKGRMESEIEFLSDWASHPSPISESAIGNFADAVERGLIAEGGHTKEQVEDAAYRVHDELIKKNDLLKDQGMN